MELFLNDFSQLLIEWTVFSNEAQTLAFLTRCWVLLDVSYNIYLFKEGVLRTASESYKPTEYSDITSHLTNHSLQKEMSPKFGHFEEGNEMFFPEFNRYLYRVY